MSSTFSFSLISPECIVASGEATAVVLPGVQGDFTVLKNHAALVSVLREGKVSVLDGEAKGDYDLGGGFAEVTDKGLSVLMS